MSWFVFGSLFALAACWGPTFLLIKIGVEEISPVMLTMIRCFTGACFLLIYTLATRRSFKPTLPYFKEIAVMAVIGNVLPFTFCAWAETMVQSSTAGIIEGTTPLITALFTILFVPHRKVPREQVEGLVLGFIGILVLFAPDILQIEASRDEWFFGKILLLGMAVCFAASFIYTKEKLENCPHIPAVCLQLFIATALLVVISFWTESSYHVTPLGIKCAALLGVFGTAIPWCFYFYLTRHATATDLSLAIYLLPVVAMVLGVVVLEETIRWNLGIGILIILFSLFFAGGFVSRIKFSRRQNPMLKG
ncbi:MAG: DMT family transporter [Chlamydiia bacterium]|nr:DMT family transporter [Chlamydiia bacterium]